MMDDVAALFTRKDGAYVFARWGRPIVPVVFGVDDASLAVFKGAIEAVVSLAGHKMAEVVPLCVSIPLITVMRAAAEGPPAVIA